MLKDEDRWKVGLVGLPFWLQSSSSDETLKQYQCSQYSFAHWTFDKALIGWMAEAEEKIFGGDCMDGFVNK